MAWTIEFSDGALRQLDQLDSVVRRRISNFLHERLAKLADPRQIGTALVGDYKGIWRYRVGDYRILCRIDGGRFVVLVISLGHRSKIYDM